MRRSGTYAFTLLASLMSMCVVRAQDEGEGLVDKILASATALRAGATQAQLRWIEELQSKLSECPAGARGETYSITQIAGQEIRYAGIDTDHGKHCIFMGDPVNRALTLSEARELMVALVLEPPSVKSKSLPADGEQRLAQLLRRIAEPGSVSRVSHDSYEIKNLAECRAIPMSDRQGRADVSSKYIFNALYSWKRIQGKGVYCLHLERPVERDLSLTEARGFVLAEGAEFETR